MRLPWIRRKEHELRLETLRTLREAEREGMRDDFRRETARCAEWQATAERLLEERKTWAGRLAAAEKAAEIWMDRAHEANAEAAAARQCPACSAKDQTIALMADVVDFERSRTLAAGQRPPNAEGAVRVLPTRPEDVEERKWVTDDEEAIMGALQSGALGADPEEAHERASKMLAAIGAQNLEVQIVK